MAGKTETSSLSLVKTALFGAPLNLPDAVDWKAGIVLRQKTGDPVKAGDTVAVLSAETEERLNAGCEAFAGALRYGKERPEEEKLILAVVD